MPRFICALGTLGSLSTLAPENQHSSPRYLFLSNSSLSILLCQEDFLNPRLGQAAALGSHSPLCLPSQPGRPWGWVCILRRPGRASQGLPWALCDPSRAGALTGPHSTTTSPDLSLHLAPLRLFLAPLLVYTATCITLKVVCAPHHCFPSYLHFTIFNLLIFKTITILKFTILTI